MPATSFDHRFWPTEGEKRMTSARVDAVEILDAQISRLQAQRTRVLAAEWESVEEQIARIDSAESKARELPLRSAAAEYATAGRVSDSTMQNALERAGRIARDFPAALAALGEGATSQAHVLVIAEAGRAITDPVNRVEFEAAALHRATRMTPGQLRNALALLADRLQPRAMSERHRAAREDRRVWVDDLAEGMSDLHVLAPTVLAHGIHDRLTQQAKALRADADAEDRRTIDQIRADLLADMLLTSTPGAEPLVEGDAAGGLGAIRAVVQVTVPALTLIGVENSAAELAGRSPIDPDTARILAGDATSWVRLLTHPVTGTVAAVDRYEPSAEMKRFLTARDRHCRFPGCRMPAHRCDLDHNHDFALGGKTEICNLSHFCRRHHVLKHQTPWRAKQVSGGLIEWTSPTGRVYIDEPEPVVSFAASSPLPPGDPAPF